MDLSKVNVGDPATIFYVTDYYAAKVVSVKGKNVTVIETATVGPQTKVFSLRKNGRLVLKGMKDNGVGLMIGSADQYIHRE